MPEQLLSPDHARVGHPQLQTPGLQPGDLCEGDGECGTDPGLDNCDDADMYIVRDAAPYIPSTAPTLKRIDDACPVLRQMEPKECQGWTMAQLDIDNWQAAMKADPCEGDGECGTDPGLNNCQAGDMYVVVTAFSGGVDVSTIRGILHENCDVTDERGHVHLLL